MTQNTPQIVITDCPTQEWQTGDVPLTTTSQIVAKSFGKRHDNILRDIDKHVARFKAVDPEWTLLNFEECLENNELANGKPDRYYRLTELAFVKVVFAFTGDKAARVQVAFLKEFKRMREHIKALQDWRKEVAERSLANQEKLIAIEQRKILMSEQRKVKKQAEKVQAAQKGALVSMFGYDPVKTTLP